VSTGPRDRAATDRLRLPALDEVEKARQRLAGLVVPAPLLPLGVEHGNVRVWLKLECLQPIGSFKLRGAGNAMALVPRAALGHGVWTASAGNMGQGIAWMARRQGVPCRVVVPDHAPEAKLDRLRDLGAAVATVPFEQWWSLMAQRLEPSRLPAEARGLFIHPVADRNVMAGNGTIGLELLEDLPDLEAVVIPFGGGGLGCGIAAVMRELAPHVRLFAAEVETAAPLAAALAAGQPTPVPYRPSFVDGIGSSEVLPRMWPLVKDLFCGSIVVSLQQVSDAIRLLAIHNRVIAEGAGAAAVAAAFSGRAGSGAVAAVVSGGNLDRSVLARILAGELPLPGPKRGDDG